ncbi:MAG: nitrile hydratase accessory protein [Albidovulum sp.]
MFAPDDPLAPSGPTFAEPWHAQTLAIADALITGGHFSATDWAETLGASLRAAHGAGAPDTSDTYYSAALAALEILTAQNTSLSSADLARRKEQWKAAYRRTPHGKPVLLDPN